MKRLYTVAILILLAASYASAQVVTERCWHLDKVQFLEHKQDFWRSHKLFSTTARTYAASTGGFYNLTELTYGFGLKIITTPFSHNHLGITTVNGYRFGSGLALGGGIGFLKYNYRDEDDGWMLPVYLDARYFIGKQKNKFFVAADGGFLFNFEDFQEHARYFLNPQLGIIIPVTRSAQLSFAAGLYTQYDYDFFNRPGEGIRDSFINLKLGLLFGK
jgi:hypothetical protein